MLLIGSPRHPGKQATGADSKDEEKYHMTCEHLPTGIDLSSYILRHTQYDAADQSTTTGFRAHR